MRLPAPVLSARRLRHARYGTQILRRLTLIRVWPYQYPTGLELFARRLRTGVWT